jgi:hypothetical protein
MLCRLVFCKTSYWKFEGSFQISYSHVLFSVADPRVCSFKSHVFRPEKCQNCFLPKAVHTKAPPEAPKKVGPPVSPRPGRSTISQLAASFESHLSTSPAAASAPPRRSSKPTIDPVPSAAPHSHNFPQPAPAGAAVNPPAHPTPSPAPATVPDFVLSPPSGGLLTQVPTQTPKPSAPAEREDGLDMGELEPQRTFVRLSSRLVVFFFFFFSFASSLPPALTPSSVASLSTAVRV